MSPRFRQCALDLIAQATQRQRLVVYTSVLVKLLSDPHAATRTLPLGFGSDHTTAYSRIAALEGVFLLSRSAPQTLIREEMTNCDIYLSDHLTRPRLRPRAPRCFSAERGWSRPRRAETAQPDEHLDFRCVEWFGGLRTNQNQPAQVLP